MTKKWLYWLLTNMFLYDIGLVVGLYIIGYYLGFITNWAHDWVHPSTSVQCYHGQSGQNGQNGQNGQSDKIRMDQEQMDSCPDDGKCIVKKSKVEGGFVYQMRICGFLVVDIRKQNIATEQHKVKF